MLLIQSVEKEGFKAGLRKFNPKYDLTSRNHFSRVMFPTLYSETHEKLGKLLGGDEIEYFSSTTDLWSSDAWSHTWYISFIILIREHGSCTVHTCKFTIPQKTIWESTSEKHLHTQLRSATEMQTR